MKVSWVQEVKDSEDPSRFRSQPNRKEMRDTQFEWVKGDQHGVHSRRDTSTIDFKVRGKVEGQDLDRLYYMWRNERLIWQLRHSLAQQKAKQYRHRGLGSCYRPYDTWVIY